MAQQTLGQMVSARSWLLPSDSTSAFSELAEQKSLVKQLRVDAEMTQAALTSREREVEELTSKYREALAQVHSAPEMEDELRQELERITQDRDAAQEEAEKAQNEYQKERQTAAKAAQRVYQLEVDVYRAKELAEAQKQRAEEALETVSSQEEDLELAQARAEKAVEMLDAQKEELEKAEGLETELEAERAEVARIKLEANRANARAERSEASATTERSRLMKALEDVRSMRERALSEKDRADKASDAITAAKTEALARARAEAAEIMAGTHDAAVEDVKALRSKLNEQNEIIAKAKKDLEAAGGEVKALKDETKKATASAQVDMKKQIESVSADATAAIMALKQEHENEINELTAKHSSNATTAVKAAVAASRKQAAEEHGAVLKRELQAQQEKLIFVLGEEHEKLHKDIVSEKDNELTALRMQLFDFKTAYCPEMIEKSEMQFSRKRSFGSDRDASEESDDGADADSSDDEVPELNDENENTNVQPEVPSPPDPMAKSFVSAVGSFFGVGRAKRQRV